MKLLFAENLAVLLCAAGGLIYGGGRYLRRKQPLYASMIVLGVGCVMLGRMYQCVRLLTGYGITENFQVGILGIAGAFLFFFSSNFAQIDSLVDDGGPEFARYRFIALLGPILIAALYVAVALSPVQPVGKLVRAVVSVPIGASCYYHVKHMIVPDVDYGVVRCLRRFNGLTLIFGILCMLEMLALAWSLELPLLVVSVLLCAVCGAMIPVMDRGVQTWRT